MMSERTKACAITKKTKQAVYERDGGWCILCGALGLPEAHYIPRSAGGLGVEQNIVTLCRRCHRRYDETEDREAIKEILRDHLMQHYEEWNEEDLIYKKYGGML